MGYEVIVLEAQALAGGGHTIRDPFTNGGYAEVGAVRIPNNHRWTGTQILKLAPVSRVCYQTKTRFWRHDPIGELGGLTLIGTDTNAGRVWNTSQLQPDKTLGMLQSY